MSLKIYVVQYGNHWPHTVTKQLKCDYSELRYAVGIKYTLAFKDLIKKNYVK